MQRQQMSNQDLANERDMLKREVDLIMLLEHLGWQRGRQGGGESCGNARGQLLHRGNVTIRVGTSARDIPVWWQLGTTIGGTCIDVYTKLEGLSTEDAYRRLRERQGVPNGGVGRTSMSGTSTGRPPDHRDALPSDDSSGPQKTDEERAALVVPQWSAALPATNLGYTRQRGIRDDILIANNAFVRQVRHNGNWNIAFGYPEIAADGLPNRVVGYERRWFTSWGARRKAFADHGLKTGLWLSHIPSDPAIFDTIVIAEATINALSFAQLASPSRALLVAFAGTWTGGNGGVQERALIAVCQRLPRTPIMVATDNDEKGRGRAYLSRIRAALHAATGDSSRILDCIPVGTVVDWNDVLMEESGAIPPEPDPFVL